MCDNHMNIYISYFFWVFVLIPCRLPLCTTWFGLAWLDWTGRWTYDVSDGSDAVHIEAKASKQA